MRKALVIQIMSTGLVCVEFQRAFATQMRLNDRGE